MQRIPSTYLIPDYVAADYPGCRPYKSDIIWVFYVCGVINIALFLWNTTTFQSMLSHSKQSPLDITQWVQQPFHHLKHSVKYTVWHSGSVSL